jgi:hypothetical protein
VTKKRHMAHGGILSASLWRVYRRSRRLLDAPWRLGKPRDGEKQRVARSSGDSQKLVPVIALFTGAGLIPVSALAIVFGGGGPLAPSKPPQLISPFGPQAPPEASQSTQPATYLCVCDQTYCGNNAISGRHGQIRKDIPADDLARKYGPERTGDEATGWVCLEQGPYRCECSAETCGNDATEAVHGAVFEGISTERVVDEFRPWRTDDGGTGWNCSLGSTIGE